MTRLMLIAIALWGLPYLEASAKGYSDSDCEQGSRGMTLRLVAAMPSFSGPNSKWDGLFEIANNRRSVVTFSGSRVRGRFHIGFPEAELQAEDAGGRWESADVHAVPGAFHSPDKLDVHPGKRATLVANIDWFPDFIPGLENKNLMMQTHFRMFFRDAARVACIASEPFNLPQ
jgi:hypothetical protein